MKRLLLWLVFLQALVRPVRAEEDLKAAIARLRARFTVAPASATTPGEDAYAGLLEGLFSGHPMTHVRIQSFAPDGKPVVSHLYTSENEVHIVAQGDDWNLAATPAGTFEWQPGKSTGLRIKRDNDELLNYLLYRIDAGGFVSSIYDYYRTNPGKFDVLDGAEPGLKILQMKQPMKELPISAIYLTEKPLWFRGRKAKLPTGKPVEVLISAPEGLKALPAELIDRLKAVRFEESPFSLKRHLVFP